MRAATVILLYLLVCLGGVVQQTEAGEDRTQAPATTASVLDSRWIQKADMPTMRCGHSAITLDGKIYVIGGSDTRSGPAFNIVEVYDPTTDTWDTTQSDMPTARANLGACVLDGKIYALGGGKSFFWEPQTVVEVYDPLTDTWTRGVDLPRPRMGLTASVVDGKIYVIGGADALENSYAEVDVFDPASQTWARGADFPLPRFNLTASVLDGKVYAIGGHIGSPWHGLVHVHVYDPSTDTWMTGASLQTGRKYFTSASLNHKVYVFGGSPGHEEMGDFMSTVEEYDPARNAWMVASQMPTPRVASAASVWEGKVYVFGGDSARDMVNSFQLADSPTYEYFPSRVSVFDTVYTPPGDVDGDLMATLCLPAVSNGIGVVLAPMWTVDRDQALCWARACADNGYLAMAIDYHDFTAAGRECVYPKPVRSFKLAVEFLRRNAGRFGITTGKVVGLGQSEGAYHWGQSITWDNDDAFFETDPTVDDHLDAAVLLYGAYDNAHLLAAASFSIDQVLASYFSPSPDYRYTKGNPIANIQNITTPVLLMHGTQDDLIRYEQSVAFHDSLAAHGKVSELHVGDWPVYFDVPVDGPSTFTPRGWAMKDTVFAFLARHLLTPAQTTPDRDHPREYTLRQNYPNPFNPSTTIEFALPHATSVTLRIYNVLGEEVETLVADNYPAGTHGITWNAHGLPSGVYFIRLSGGEHVQTAKAVLMK